MLSRGTQIIFPVSPLPNEPTAPVILRRSESLESLVAFTAVPVDKGNVDGIAAPANRVQKSRSGVHYRPVVLVPSHRTRCLRCHCLHFVQTLEVTLGNSYQLPAFSNFLN